MMSVLMKRILVLIVSLFYLVKAEAYRPRALAAPAVSVCRKVYFGQCKDSKNFSNSRQFSAKKEIFRLILCHFSTSPLQFQTFYNKTLGLQAGKYSSPGEFCHLTADRIKTSPGSVKNTPERTGRPSKSVLLCCFLSLLYLISWQIVF